ACTGDIASTRRRNVAAALEDGRALRWRDETPRLTAAVGRDRARRTALARSTALPLCALAVKADLRGAARLRAARASSVGTGVCPIVAERDTRNGAGDSEREREQDQAIAHAAHPSYSALRKGACSPA